MQGIIDRITDDGIRILQVHYSADPDKNPATPKGKKWLKTEALDGYPGGMKSAKWKREMEIDFDVVEGQKVFEGIELHEDKLFIPPFDVPVTWQLRGSFDFASRGVSAFHVHAKAKGQEDYYTIWEYYKKESTYPETAEAIKNCPYWGRLGWISADPCLWARNQQIKSEVTGKIVLTSYALLFAGLGIEFVPGSCGGDLAIADMIKYDLWGNLLTGENQHQQPRYRIFKNCPMAWWELKRLRYKDWTVATGQDRNVKEEIVDRDNHFFDNLKYYFKKMKGAGVGSAFDREKNCQRF